MNRWTRSGPLPIEVRNHLAAGFGARLRTLRKARGWTQADLAAEIGRSRNTVHRIETGHHRPTFEVIVQLSVAFAGDGNPLQVAAELGTLASPHVRLNRRYSLAKVDSPRMLLALLQRRIRRITRNRARVEKLARQEAALLARIDRARARFNPSQSSGTKPSHNR